MRDRAQVVRARSPPGRARSRGRRAAAGVSRSKLRSQSALSSNTGARPAVLARLDDLVVPVGALDQADRQRLRARRSRRAQARSRSSCCGRVAQVGLQHDPGRRPVAELGLGEQLEARSSSGRLARVERLHVDVQVRAELARGRSSGRSRGAASSRPDARARRAAAAASAPRPSPTGSRAAAARASRARACGRSGQRRGRRGERLERLARSARRSGRPRRCGHRRLAEQVDRASRSPSLPQLARASPSARCGVSPTMKRCAMWRTPAAAAAPSAVAARLRVAAIRIAASSERRPLVDLAEEAGQVAREVVERAAGRRDVDEAGTAPRAARASAIVARIARSSSARIGWRAGLGKPAAIRRPTAPISRSSVSRSIDASCGFTPSIFPRRAACNQSRRASTRRGQGRMGRLAVQSREVNSRGKSGHRRARAVGNAHPGKPAGKCHRNDTADGAPTREARTGKGEMVR